MRNGVTHFMVANGMTEFGRGTYNDVSPYSMFDGVINNEDEYPQTMILDFSNASGKRKRRTAKSKTSTIRSRTEARQKARQSRQAEKIAINKISAESQKDIAKTIGKMSPEEAKLVESLANDKTTKSAPVDSKMSKTLKNGLIIGGFALAVVVAIVVVRKMRKGKKGGK